MTWATVNQYWRGNKSNILISINKLYHFTKTRHRMLYQDDITSISWCSGLFLLTLCRSVAHAQGNTGASWYHRASNRRPPLSHSSCLVSSWHTDMSLLAIPLKVTGDVDLVRPIKALISSLRSPSASDTNSLTELQALRNKMVLNVKNKNYSDSAQRDIENYFDQLGESDQIS